MGRELSRGRQMKFCRSVTDTQPRPCRYFRTLLSRGVLSRRAAAPPAVFSGNSLRIGAFGARRPLKNFMSAAGATVEVATQFDANLEVGVSAGRAEGGRNTRSVHAMIAGLPNIRLVECGWRSWPRFRTTARHVHLLLQPSYTESFNMVMPTASPRARRPSSPKPSTGRPIIGKRPSTMCTRWPACPLSARRSACPGDGLAALERHNRDGLEAWKAFLAA